jgi:homoserine acetyltransferase
MGGSLGGMQALTGRSAIRSGSAAPCDRGGAEPLGTEHRIQRARAAIMTDPDFHAGRYYDYKAARLARRAYGRTHHLHL